MTSAAVLQDLHSFLADRPALAESRMWRLLDVALLVKLLLHGTGLGELSAVKLKGYVGSTPSGGSVVHRIGGSWSLKPEGPRPCNPCAAGQPDKGLIEGTLSTC